MNARTPLNPNKSSKTVYLENGRQEQIVKHVAFRMEINGYKIEKDPISPLTASGTKTYGRQKNEKKTHPLKSEVKVVTTEGSVQC